MRKLLQIFILMLLFINLVVPIPETEFRLSSCLKVKVLVVWGNAYLERNLYVESDHHGRCWSVNEDVAVLLVIPTGSVLFFVLMYHVLLGQT